ncbi:16713_t:CDS:2, partial [Racocetra persica]
NSILRREGLEKLQQYCTDRLKKEPESILRSPDFVHLNEDIVVELLKQVNIQMSEIEIWDYVLKWGVAQTRMLNDNFGRWSSKDFLILELSLHNCLPWIRFFHMPYREFSIKVMPFEKILPKKLVHDVQRYHFVQNSQPLYNAILPPRLGVCNSSIIKWCHMGLIASWIDRKDCESIGKSDSLTTKRTTTVSRVADASKAVYSFVALGPYFGDGDLKVCIRYDSLSCSCTHKSYSLKILEKSDWMVVEEYEVFKKIYDGKLKGNIEGGANDDIIRDD